MSETKKIFIKEYCYNLPDDSIAKFPLEKRDESKLLVYRNCELTQSIFRNITDYLPDNSYLIFNNTKVIQARIYFQKETGAKIEIFCLEPYNPSDYVLSFQRTLQCTWKCLIGNAKRWKDDEISKEIYVSGQPIILKAKKIGSDSNYHLIQFSWDKPVTFAGILEATGQLPIPPYLHRETCERDNETYQTVYSKVKGSVAAPTAGLHFTEDVFDSLRRKGIRSDEVTLHVGAGTFRPVKSETVNEHEMHSEFFSVSKSTIENVLKNRDRIIAVGTTSVRTLESLYYIGTLLEQNKLPLSTERLKVGQWQPYEVGNELTVEKSLMNILDYLAEHELEVLEAETQIIITPGYKFKIVKGIITNFHQPQSTLLLLIAAFVGDDWKKIYRYAMENDFRFLSYGDSSLLFPR
jgi:S-adenosylmethionine:tRNA ribosyltransferase-isomerase